jgi:hypothetical protein
MTLGSTRPLTEMSTINLPGGKGRPALKADSQRYWPPCPVTGIAFTFLFEFCDSAQLLSYPISLPTVPLGCG